MQKIPLLLLLILTACASRTKTLDRLVGTSIDDLLPKWEEPKVIIDLQAGQKAYTYIKVNAQSKSFVRPVGDKYTKVLQRHLLYVYSSNYRLHGHHSIVGSYKARYTTR